ncbi:MAG TPA: FKBP-type peptidyl-prolyl cis-trans isomerase [Ktedonobacteraceae bacterium]|nr:FKBP-type peptidyl-prolyl cis-trans isomerase [Ktedonobacteraceae bacterium]
MPQTVNGRNASENAPKPVQKTYRPGQRQQERMQRLARRRKRQRIIWSSIAAVLLIAAGITGAIMFQNYSTQQAALASMHATATANASAHATATAVTRDCFVTPGAPAIPSIYTATATPKAGPSTAPEISGTPVTLKDGLKYVDMKVGTGPAAKDGDTVTVNYTGWLASTCKEFDSSYNSHQDESGNTVPPAPFPFTLGKGQVIKGWDEGVVGMKAGGIRRLYIPAALGYGSQSSGPIPANSNLIFDVQVISIKS